MQSEGRAGGHWLGVHSSSIGRQAGRLTPCRPPLSLSSPAAVLARRSTRAVQPRTLPRPLWTGVGTVPQRPRPLAGTARRISSHSMLLKTHSAIIFTCATAATAATACSWKKQTLTLSRRAVGR